VRVAHPQLDAGSVEVSEGEALAVRRPDRRAQVSIRRQRHPDFAAVRDSLQQVSIESPSAVRTIVGGVDAHPSQPQHGLRQVSDRRIQHWSVKQRHIANRTQAQQRRDGGIQHIKDGLGRLFVLGGDRLRAPLEPQPTRRRKPECQWKDASAEPRSRLHIASRAPYGQRWETIPLSVSP